MEVGMEWILVLVFAGPGQFSVTTIPGHKSEAACVATLDNAKRSAEKAWMGPHGAAADMLRNSFCVERAK
jgi:hypothetical protein